MKHAQLAIIGGGPAGYAAAIAAGRLGAQALLIDERPPAGNLSEAERASKRAEDIARFGVDFQYGSVVWGLFADNVMGVATGDNSYQLQADQIILATGSTDLPCPFTGGSLPGVFTSRAVRHMLRQWRVLPGNRFVVLGDGSDAEEIVRDIEVSGGNIIARVTAGEASSFSAFGNQGIEAVEIDGNRLEADVVVVAIGRQPDIELALMVECAIGYSEVLGGFVPVRDENLRTSVQNILVAGDLAGICDALAAAEEGRFAGVSVARSLALIDDRHFDDERARYLNATGDRVMLSSQVAPSYVQV